MSDKTGGAKEVVTPWECKHSKVLVTSELLPCDQMDDANLAPLLNACLRHGIMAYTGCEDVGDSGDAMVIFGVMDHAVRFLKICCRSQPDFIHVEFVPPEDDDGVTVIQVSFPTWAIEEITEDVLQAAEEDKAEGVTIHYVTDWSWLHTHGMDAHGLPELEMRDVPAFLAEGATGLLQHVCGYMLRRGVRIKAGETMNVSPRTGFRFIAPEPLPGAEDHYEGERLQVVDLEPMCEDCQAEGLSTPS
jgi:hypothetical protein